MSRPTSAAGARAGIVRSPCSSAVLVRRAAPFSPLTPPPTPHLPIEDFAMNYNQVLQAGIAAIGTTLKIQLDIQAVQGDTLPTT